jgi:hypothetical protein
MSKIEKKMNSSNTLKDFQWNEHSIIIYLDDDDE